MNDRLFSFPQIGETAFSVGPLDVRWYALAYIVGIILGWAFMRSRVRAGLSVLQPSQLETLLNLIIFGVIIGGRLGYVLFYNPAFYASAPIEILKVWQGGMSFHGGLIGVMLAIIWSARRFGLSAFAIGDEVAVVAPIGLFFGRIANFINGELYGRVTDHPLGIVFPRGGAEPRHPSQLYEAVLEGLVLFILLLWLTRAKHRAGYGHGLILSGFLCGYGFARLLIEFVREPDRHIGFFSLFSSVQITMGQLLSLPMMLVGCAGLFICIRQARKNS